jgi:hypothetical protein
MKDLLRNSFYKIICFVSLFVSWLVSYLVSWLRKRSQNTELDSLYLNLKTVNR